MDNSNSLPLVSVIIPMYNAEKYIEACLVSVVGQTLKDFEVIVVDDCSTDDSVKIVENYAPKFDWRLKLVSMKKNSGSASLPRNKGLELSRGKYVYFMDNDDVITVNTLETFYDTAEKYQADVVICKNFLTSSASGENFIKQARLYENKTDTTVQLLNDNIAVRMRSWKNNFFEVFPWLKFSRRDFLVENEIKFLPVVQEDSYWTLELVCLAKKVILIPHLLYIHRRRKNSLTKKAFEKELTAKSVHKKLDRVINGLKYIDEFMGGLEFFQQNPKQRYDIINHIVNQNVGWIINSYVKIKPHIICEKIREAFEKEMGDFDVLISYLLAESAHLTIENLIMKEKIKKLEDLNAKNDL